MLGGQFRGRIRAKPEVSKFGTLKKPTNTSRLKKEAQAKVSDYLGKPKKSLLEDTKSDVKKKAEEEAARLEDLKNAQEVKDRAEKSKIQSSDSFLTKLSSVLGVKKSALKVKDKETILADTNAKIEELRQKAVEDAEQEATLAKNIKVEANKAVLSQKVNDLNERITTLKNNFFGNINNIFTRASPPDRIRDNASGRIDKIRSYFAELRAKRTRDSEIKNKSNEQDVNIKTDIAKNETDIAPLNRLGDSETVRKKAKNADDDAQISKDKDDGGKKDGENETKKVENAKNDSDNLGGPKKKFDSDDAKNKSKKADDDAKKSKDGDAEGKKKDGDESAKTKDAENDSKKLKDSDDSKKVREDAENQKKKDSEQNKKAKNENDGMARVRDGLSKLSNLLGMLGTILTITTTYIPPPVTQSFCQKNPGDPKCRNTCVGPLCDIVGIPVVNPPYINDDNYAPTGGPSYAPGQKRSPFSAPEFGNILIYLLFTIQNNPEDDVSILLEPNDEKIRFIDSQIIFPKSEWETTVKIPCYISIPDLSGNEEFESLPVDEKVDTIKKKKKKKRVEKDLVSLTDYYPTKNQIDILAIRLRYLLNKSDTDLEKALQEIQENIRIKRQLGIYENKKQITSLVNSDSTIVVPTLDSSEYDEVREDVEPTYDDNKYKSIDTDSIEPTYDDSKYDTYNEEVEPTYDINPPRKRFEFEPTMVTEGGQEEEEEIANSDELPDEYKAYFTMRIVGDVKVKFDIEVVSESPLYQTDPDAVTFDSKTPANEVAVFSSESFNLVQNTFKIDNAVKESEEFNEDINNEYLNEYENILEDREYEDAKARDLYDQTYNRSLQDSNRRIREAEYLRNQLVSGGLRKHLTRKNTHNLSAK